MFQLITGISLLVQTYLPPVIPIEDYSTTVETRRARVPFSALDEKRKELVIKRLTQQSRANCNIFAAEYAKKQTVPSIIPAKYRVNYKFFHNPEFSAARPNIWGLKVSPQLIRFDERVIGYTYTVPPKAIYEADFKFSCHGGWRNMKPNIDNN